MYCGERVDRHYSRSVTIEIARSLRDARQIDHHIGVDQRKHR